ncbi:MAG: 3-deoxy-D-manno-octulosonic acid transferase [Mariniphaga sp.]|nr:3-deoxy-D-manno-octulosonic acid transferase [Mariniphaga sp.]
MLYNIGIYLYGLLVYLTFPFNRKAHLFVRGRKNWKKNLTQKIISGSKYIWFHCASLGEFEQGRPLIEKVKESYPDYKILLTFFSPSGFEIRKNYDGADIISYLPIDTPRNVKSFFDIVKPEKIFFVKYEYWYNYISEAKHRKIPLYVVSAIFRPGQLFFKSNLIGNWYRKTLQSIEHFFVQNEESDKLLSKIGLKNVTISGDTRFDRVASIASSAKTISFIERFKDAKPLVVIGSSWAPDEELLIRFINQSEGVKFVIAPHEVLDSNVARIKNSLKKQVEQYSKIQKLDPKIYDVVIIDSIGMLSSIYQYGEIAYIGGGFGVGIHNILEAATFGLPIIFGPNYRKFKEANDLVELKGAFPVLNYEELEQILSNLLANSEKLRRLSDVTKNYVDQNQGATQIIINKVFIF